MNAKKILNATEKNKDLILSAERYIWAHPETGYKEFETSAYLEKQFISLGYDLVKPDELTGFTTEIDTGKKGPTLLILGELDSIICPSHKDANPTTGAVHSCGHNAQSASLLGIASVLKEDGILDGLCGKIRLCAVPAEELLEIEYRSNLMAQGKIKYFGGKTEFLHRGMFDGVDIAFMVHTGRSYNVDLGCVGCVAKKIVYKGVSAHAGGSPWEGKNALYAATCGLNALNSIRETFRDQDLIRVHPIITSGGSMVNAIPETTTLESYVRGISFDAIKSTNKKVNQALIGAALSLNANIEIIDSPGYSPQIHDQNMINLARDAFKQICPDRDLTIHTTFETGSTDMGDLSCLMPIVQPYCGGATGTEHGNDYQIADPYEACVLNTAWQVAMATMLLEDQAKLASKIIAEFKPIFKSKQEFLDYIDGLNCSGDRIIYNKDGSVTAILD